MKTSTNILLIALLLTAAIGCDDDKSNPITPLESIENTVNAAEPIDHVLVGNSDGTVWEFGQNAVNSLTDAYAKDGYLVVLSASTHYFNLQLATSVQISGHTVELQY